MPTGLGKNVFALLLLLASAGFVFAASAYFSSGETSANPGVLDLDSDTQYGGFLGMVANFAKLDGYTYAAYGNGFGDPQLGPKFCCYCLTNPLVADSKEACGKLNASNYWENVSIPGANGTICTDYSPVPQKEIDDDQFTRKYSARVTKDRCYKDYVVTGRKNIPPKKCCFCEYSNYTDEKYGTDSKGACRKALDEDDTCDFKKSLPITVLTGNDSAPEGLESLVDKYQCTEVDIKKPYGEPGTCCVFLSKKDLPKGPDYETEKDNFFANPACTKQIEASEEDFYANPTKFKLENSCSNISTSNYRPKPLNAQKCCFCVYDDSGMNSRDIKLFKNTCYGLLSKEPASECGLKATYPKSRFNVDSLSNKFNCSLGVKIIDAGHGKLERFASYISVCIQVFGAPKLKIDALTIGCSTFNDDAKARKHIADFVKLAGKAGIKDIKITMEGPASDNWIDEDSPPIASGVIVRKYIVDARGVELKEGACADSSSELDVCSPVGGRFICTLNGTETSQICCPTIGSKVYGGGSWQEPGKSCNDCPDLKKNPCLKKDVAVDARGNCGFEWLPDGTDCGEAGRKCWGGSCYEKKST